MKMELWAAGGIFSMALGIATVWAVLLHLCAGLSYTKQTLLQQVYTDSVTFVHARR